MLISFLSGCTHYTEADLIIAADYPKYLTNNAGKAYLPSTDKVKQYFLPPQTKSFSYQFKAVMSGLANTWVVEFGKMLDDTLKSTDVQAAFGTLTSVNSASVPGSTLVFELRQYKFDKFAAHISLNVRLMNEGTVTFEKNYIRTGSSQGSKMFWGGFFAQKEAVQESTK